MVAAGCSCVLVRGERSTGHCWLTSSALAMHSLQNVCEQLVVETGSVKGFLADRERRSSAFVSREVRFVPLASPAYAADLKGTIASVSSHRCPGIHVQAHQISVDWVNVGVLGTVHGRGGWMTCLDRGKGVSASEAPKFPGLR